MEKSLNEAGLTLEELLRVYKQLLEKADCNGFVEEGGLSQVITIIAWNEKIAESKVNRYRQMLELQGYLVNKGGGTFCARWYILSPEPRLVPIPKFAHGGNHSKK